MEGRTAFLVVDRDRRFVDASPEALELFGVELATLRTMRVGDFTVPSERAAVLSAFEAMVDTGDEGLIGEADIVRPDGMRIRIRFTTAPDPSRPGHYRSTVRSVGEARAGVSIRTGAQVLADWRDAERDTARQASGTDEHREALRRVEAYRDEYHEVTGGRSGKT